MSIPVDAGAVVGGCSWRRCAPQLSHWALPLLVTDERTLVRDAISEQLFVP